MAQNLDILNAAVSIFFVATLLPGGQHGIPLAGRRRGRYNPGVVVTEEDLWIGELPCNGTCVSP
jgi:hypothetical protein